jgi:hypothetical protein
MSRVTRPLSPSQWLAVLCLSGICIARSAPTAYAGTPQTPAQATPQTTGSQASPADPQSGSATAPPPQAAASDPSSDDERLASPAEPEYRLVNLATTLRLPKHKASFELTHRFDGNLRANSFSENASNLFGLDQGAAVGLEFRYAVARHVEAAIYRTNIDKTIQFYTKLDVIHQHAGVPLGVSAIVSVEGTNNFHTNYQPGISVIVSRDIATRLALYVEPSYIGRTGIGAGINQGTAFVGMGARARVRQRMYLVAEVSPRVSGYAPGTPEYGFGIEERVGGHVFQLNFSNTTGTTMGQVARGGFPNSLFLGFNLARKFF